MSRRSFRLDLAWRATATMVLGLGAIATVTYFTLRAALDRELDASILSVAQIQASSLTSAPSGVMRFHDWELTPQEAASMRNVIRYAEVWRSDGVSLLRNQYMTSDLPLDRADLARADSGHLVWTETTWHDLPIRTLYYPLVRLGPLHHHHILQVAATLTARNQMLGRTVTFFALLIVTMSAAAFLGASWLADRAMRPVYEVIDQADEIRAGSLDRRIRAWAGVREYHRLVEVLNTMLERIQGAFEAQRRFTADASHELRSPLTAMRGELDLALRRERSPEEYRRVIGSTLEEVVRLSRITEDLLVLARSDSGALGPRPERVDAGEVAARVIERLSAAAERKGVALELHREGETTAWVDAGMVGQIAWNLTDNAIKFTPEGGRVDVWVRRDAADVVVEVVDTGPGFEAPAQAFRRFYREDVARAHGTPEAGTGLGLAIVQALTEAHGGSALVLNGPEGGARVVVRLPAGEPSPTR